MFHGENDRVKLLVLYCGMLDDERLVRAASGALAMMAHDRVISNKITTVCILHCLIIQSTFHSLLFTTVLYTDYRPFLETEKLECCLCINLGLQIS